MTDSTPTLASYDETPYTDLPFAQSHPARLAVMARLFGVDAPEVGTARVLELGCAVGGNLIPMAVAMPDAHLVGIDLSARQIADGRRVVTALGLENIELRHADIALVDASYGMFDYIVCHGIYSWVPAAIREKLLAVCNTNLKPNGVAYVSYNAMPGWGIRGIIRDAMLYHSRNAKSGRDRIRQSREALQLLSRHLPSDTPYAAVLRQDLDGLAGVADAYLGHDHLEENNEAFYFHEFVDAAHRHHLQYLAEAEFSAMAPQIPGELKDTLRRIASDLIAREQYLDFLHHRSFRQTLLVHAGVHINRKLEPQTLRRFDIAAAIQPVSANPVLEQGANEGFRTASGASISTVSAISKAALMELEQSWPLALPFDELLTRSRARLDGRAARVDVAEDARMLGIEMLQCYAAGVLELRVWSPRLVAHAGDRPLATPLARLQAQRGFEVTNLLHKSVTMNAFSRGLLPMLDGVRDRAALLALIAERASTGQLVLPARTGGLRGILDETLAGMGKAALLLA